MSEEAVPVFFGTDKEACRTELPLIVMGVLDTWIKGIDLCFQRFSCNLSLHQLAEGRMEGTAVCHDIAGLKTHPDDVDSSSVKDFIHLLRTVNGVFLCHRYVGTGLVHLIKLCFRKHHRRVEAGNLRSDTNRFFC
jgi:hypothetical protein